MEELERKGLLYPIDYEEETSGSDSEPISEDSLIVDKTGFFDTQTSMRSSATLQQARNASINE